LLRASRFPGFFSNTSVQFLGKTRPRNIGWTPPTATLRQPLTVPLDPRQHELTAFALAPHGQLLAVQARDAIQLGETNSGQLVHTLGGFYTPVKSLAFGSNGRLLLSGHEDGTALVWDLLAGRTAGDSLRGDDGELWQQLAGKPDLAYRVLWALAVRRPLGTRLT
jgi:WD40 repeat protein